jgi:hypothetical protein
MKTAFIFRLTYALAVALCMSSLRADELSDWQPVGSELFAAHKLSASSWNVPQLLTAYQKVEKDLEAYQAAYPHPQYGDGLPGLIVAYQRYVEVLTWEQAAATTPDDPHGMKSVIAHLQELYQKGEIAEMAGKWQEASEDYSVNYWITIWELHPQWRPAFVAQQERLYMKRCSALAGKLYWQKRAPYLDPKFQTPLSV